MPIRPAVIDPKWIADGKQHGYVGLGSTQADINNDGKLETLVKYRRNGNNCFRYGTLDHPGSWSTLLAVVAKTTTKVEVSMTHSLMQNPSKEFVANRDKIEAAASEVRQGLSVKSERFAEVRKPTKFAAGNLEVRGYDLLRDRQSYYFDRWVEDKESIDFGTLTGFRLRRQAAEQVCKFQLTPQSASPSQSFPQSKQ